MQKKKYFLCILSLFFSSCFGNNLNSIQDSSNKIYYRDEEGIKVSSEEIIREGDTLLLWIAEINPINHSIKLVRAENDLSGSQRVSDVASRENAIFALNGGFFKIYDEESHLLPHTKLNSFQVNNFPSPYFALPQKILKVNGTWFGTNSEFHSAVGWNQDGNKVIMGEVSVTPILKYINLKNEVKKFALTAVNSLDFKNANIAFTNNWRRTIQFPDEGYIAFVSTVEPSKIKFLNLKDIIEKSDRKYQIKENEVILYFYDISRFNVLVKSKFSSLEYKILSKNKGELKDWKNIDYILSGRPQIVNEGNVLTSFPDEIFYNDKYSRTSMCTLYNGNILFAVLEGGSSLGRRKSGASMRIWAEILKEKGCKDAINLDGGGSSAFYYENELKNKIRYIDNISSVPTERFISDIIIVN